MGRKAKTDLETELKRIEEEAREKARKAEELRERIKRTRIDDFARWCKRNGIDPMQFYKLAITAEWGGKVKALYAEMTAPPVGVIKPAKPEPESTKTETDISAEDNIDEDESIEDETDEVEVQGEDEEDIDEEANDGEIEEKEDMENGGEGNKESSIYGI